MKNRNLILGLILITIGAVWFLDNLNLGFSVRYLFNGIQDLWPLILVILGISIMTKNKTLERIIWIAFLIVLVSYSMFIQYNGRIFYGSNGNIDIVDNYESHNYSLSLDEGIDKGILDLDIGATKFQINGLNINNFVDLNSNLIGLEYNVSKENTTQKMSINNGGFNLDLDNGINYNTDMTINNKLSWDIDLDCGAVDGEINLKDTPLTSFDLDMGAGKLYVLLGNNTEHALINIDSGVSDINIDLPKDSGIKITMDGALNSTNFNTLGLINTDGSYISENYEHAQTQYEFDINMGVGNININYAN